MKRVVVVLVTVGMLSVAGSAQLANVSGTWELEMTWPEGKSTGTCTFQQEGESLTGTCGGTDRFPVAGRVDGNRLSWQSDVKQDGATGRMEFSGELDRQGTTIRGSCSIVGLNSGTFTMKRTR
jgi:carbon monoxide dehydrogenase subunit G